MQIDNPKIRRKRHITIGEGEKCPKCFKFMERRTHAERPGKTFYYLKWDYCRPCKHVQHYQEFKSPQWQENEQQEDFFKNI